MFGCGPDYQRVILLHGKGGTGKSQALEVLQAMMPKEACCSIPPNLWGEKFVLSDMVGRSLNVCGELPESTKIDGQVFKGVVVGEQIRTERKSVDGFHYRPIATHWFASNYLPNTSDSSSAFVRRWLILEFNRVVPEKERIPHFHEILISEEREAIAAWAIQGLPRLVVARDYTQPPSHLALLNQVRRVNNTVAAWLQSNDKVVVTDLDEDHADARASFDQYYWYQKDVVGRYGARTVGFEQFTQMMVEIGHRKTEYTDPLGVKRFKLHGIKMIGLVQVPVNVLKR